MSLTDEELRSLAVGLLKAPTDRDQQRTIGASNLCNGCDYCLASNMLGDMRETPMLDRAWVGRILGTGLHSVPETNGNKMLAAAREADDDFKRQGLSRFAIANPDALIEHRMTLGEIPNYGTVSSTCDLYLPSIGQMIDWKGTKRQKLALLRDYLWMQAGSETPLFGRQHKEIKLSEVAYAKEMQKMAYKVTTYYGQVQTYLRGMALAGYKAERGSLIFVTRDGTGWFDNPGLDGWDDVTKMHDVWPVSFDYDPGYAEALWQRGNDIWHILEGGAAVDSFASHPDCFPCGLEKRGEEKIAA